MKQSITELIKTFADLKTFVENADEIVPDNAAVILDETENKITIEYYDEKEKTNG